MFFEPPLPPRIEFLFHDLFSFNPIDKYLGGGGVRSQTLRGWR